MTLQQVGLDLVAFLCAGWAAARAREGWFPHQTSPGPPALRRHSIPPASACSGSSAPHNDKLFRFSLSLPACDIFVCRA